jgi:hypothetical protein
MGNDENPTPIEDQDTTPVVWPRDSTPTSALSMLVEAEAILLSSGYESVPASVVGAIQHDRMRVLEDAYGVVLLQCYDSVDALLDLWEEAQSLLVKALADHVIPGAARGWEGYLVLMTPARALANDVPALMDARYDTTRTRKIVITGTDRLRRGLAPILPLPEQVVEASILDPLDYLVERLATSGVPRLTSTAFLDAYRNQHPLFEALEASIVDKIGDTGDGNS